LSKNHAKNVVLLEYTKYDESPNPKNFLKQIVKAGFERENSDSRRSLEVVWATMKDGSRLRCPQLKNKGDCVRSAPSRRRQTATNT
jgi:hypothetical protein